MGVLSGGITVKRMRVGAPSSEAIDREALVARLRAHGFMDLNPEETDEDRAAGWCAIDHPFDVDFTYEKVFFGDYLCVAYRVDTLRIPSATLKAYVAQREKEIAAESGRESLARNELKELREVVRIELRKRMLPSLKTVDVVWNLVTGRVFVWTQSNGLLDELSERFERTFEVPLFPEDAVTWAQTLTPPELHDNIGAAEPCCFVSSASLRGY